MDRFIGCMVSLDCGETLGVYQGQVESINPVQGAITLVRSFRNGVPYKLPHVTLRSQDIINLEIIKSSDEVKLAEGSGQLPNLFPEKSLNVRAHTSTSPQPKIAPIKQLVVFGQTKNESRVPAFPENCFNSRMNMTNTSHSDHSMGKMNGTHQFRQKGFSITPPNLGKNQFENGHFQRVFESPNEEDMSRLKNCNKVMSSPQTPIYKSNRWNGDVKHKEAPKIPFVRPSNSFTDRFYHQPQRGYENQYSPLHKSSRPNKRNNSECFDHCDGDFDMEFDFEKNLALFDKAAVAEEVKGSQNNHVGNGRQRNGYHNHEEKYKCDENIIKGVEFVKRQISLVDNHSKREESQLGEYSTDSGLIVPGVSQSLRDKLFSLAEKMEFGRDKMVEAFGRSISDVILQYLGGSTRFEAKNSHQRPNVVILCGSNQWQSAAAVACGRHLTNRSSHVVLYHQSPRSTQGQREDPTFTAEMKFLRMAGGIVMTDVKDLPTTDNIDLVLSMLDCQPSNAVISDVARWAASKKAPVFSIEPSFAGPPLLECKRSFVCGIPGWYDSHVGQVCFCDVGLPEDIFRAAGINFKSPFFDKFFLTLHKVD